MNPVEIFTDVSTWISDKVFYAVPVFDTKMPLIVLWLVLAGAFFTVWLGFMQVRGPKLSIDLVRGKYSSPDDEGEVSHFQALATAVSGTVGLGNIAGVAVAISLGGPGATLWMIVAGLLGMATKMAECMMGVKYRREHPDGSVSGGPMYYLRDGLAERGMRPLGQVLAAFFALCMIGGAVGGGNMFQSNQATAQIIDVTGGESSFLADVPWVVGLVFAALAGAVILGGIKSIARVTEKVVPFMAVLYLAACLVVLVWNVTSVPAAVGEIIGGAFRPEGIAGGVVGALIVGFQRAAFSNEAGLGSASVAHSAVKTREPATEGFVAMLEPFIDTVVICTMTALTIIITGTWDDGDASKLGGVGLTSRSFETVLPWFPLVLALAVVLFAFSTMISWSYYGMKATGFLFGDNPVAENAFKVLFLCFTVIGSAAALEPVIEFSDSAIFLMSVPNLVGLYLMAGPVRAVIHGYFRRVRSGEVAQVGSRA
ncbi:alanine/glycine:cation symporter family protein [Phycicoccus endophyticus]|uniref:alanine/glycine:cation symporter family protein n=1 Tax=Phycicoccus endophyticus TaxID=1690220 RepID=UPI00140AB4A8|nr:alanine/glycine:cation symporter family protein [Phycicoccus endophyticus]NHI20187.1 alanine:cation symporter family protein [Phycicoccus endophyticus]GGL44606.1 alanine glycine permease [Phycicoccus endophyticus]